MNELTERQRAILARIAELSVGDLPADFTIHGKEIWEAFHLGEEINAIACTRVLDEKSRQWRARGERSEKFAFKTCADELDDITSRIEQGMNEKAQDAH